MPSFDTTFYFYHSANYKAFFWRGGGKRHRSFKLIPVIPKIATQIIHDPKKHPDTNTSPANNNNTLLKWPYRLNTDYCTSQFTNRWPWEMTHEHDHDPYRTDPRNTIKPSTGKPCFKRNNSCPTDEQTHSTCLRHVTLKRQTVHYVMLLKWPTAEWVSHLNKLQIQRLHRANQRDPKRSFWTQSGINK